MKNCFLVIMAMVLLLGACKIAFSAEPVTALVQTQSLGRHDLTDQLSCYGTITPDPEKVTSLNFPRAGLITRLLVSLGEIVKKGQALLEFETSPEAGVGYLQAQSSVDLARHELTTIQSLAAEQLATRSQVAQAQRALIDAEAALAVQKKLGTDMKKELLVAPFDGLVNDLKVARGDRIQAGTTALQLTPKDGLLVILGIEPEDRPKIKLGTPVQVTSAFDGSIRGSGMIRKVREIVNPQTRLVDVTVSLKDNRSVPLMPGMAVRGEIILKQSHGLAVPRQTVLQDNQGPYVFVVRNGRACRINVRTGIESQGMIGLTGLFQKNDRLVVLGNYELTDGMTVREAK